MNKKETSLSYIVTSCGLIIFFLSVLCRETFLSIVFDIPWSFLELIGLLLAFLPSFRISLEQLLFFIPFLISITISLIINAPYLKMSSINTYIMTISSMIILSWKGVFIRGNNIKIISALIIVFVIILSLSQYLFFPFIFKTKFGAVLSRGSFGSFINVNSAAMALFSGFIISLMVINNKKWKYIISSLLFFTIVLTGSRASLLGAVVVLFIKIVNFILRAVKYYSIKKLTLAFCLLIIVFIMLSWEIWLPVVKNTYQRTLTSGTSHRTRMWKKIIVSTADDNKFLFCGSGPSSIVYDLSADTVVRYSVTGTGLSSHNSFVHVFASYGLLGIIGVLLMIIYFFYHFHVDIILGILTIGFFETQLFFGSSILWSLLIFHDVYKNGCHNSIQYKNIS
jgi:O-antigen ligase